MARRRDLRDLARTIQRAGGSVGYKSRGRLNGPAEVVRLARIVRTLPPGAVVVETASGGEIVLADGRRAAWRCDRRNSGINVFETIADRNRRQKIWTLPRQTKDAIHRACAVR